jgi:hypothetical protein
MSEESINVFKMMKVLLNVILEIIERIPLSGQLSVEDKKRIWSEMSEETKKTISLINRLYQKPESERTDVERNFLLRYVQQLYLCLHYPMEAKEQRDELETKERIFTWLKQLGFDDDVVYKIMND